MRHPLGSGWCLAPENYASLDSSATNTYLGYSLEHSCFETDIVPWQLRPNRTYILAKGFEYFQTSKIDYRQILQDLTGHEYGFEFVIGAPDAIDVKNVVNVGNLNKTEFLSNLSRSKVLLGLGDPILSPSPYDALCLGVPFVNPIKGWDPKRPWDRSKWDSQHEALARLDPPYVYNVYYNDVEGFKKAIKTAMVTNLGERFVPEQMRSQAIVDRLGDIVFTNWKMRAIHFYEMNRLGNRRDGGGGWFIRTIAF
ncbi:hypothetical protein HDU83_005885 [Entophlyctis luteolus]|nr:hypothetical protein HDU83_005885 [Entophlyctis luteolus]